MPRIGAYLVEDAFAPLVLVRRTGPSEGPSETCAMLAALDEQLERARRGGSRVAFVYDSPLDAPAIDTRSRKVGGTWLRDPSGLLRGASTGVDLVLGSALERAVLTAHLWLGRPSIRVEVSPDLETGVHKALTALREASVSCEATVSVVLHWASKGASA